MPAKPKETATESRQRKAQLAVVAIAESDDDAEVRGRELERLSRFVGCKWEETGGGPNVGRIARLWYQDNLNGQLLIGEVAWSPEGEMVDLLPVCEERMQRVAEFARWPELPAEAARWFAEIRAGTIDEYRSRSESTGNMMSTLQRGELRALFWQDWTMQDAREWMAKVIGHAT